MMDRIGYPVLTLTRIAFGPFTLDMLDEKPYLVLDKKDVAKLLDQ
jgi:16S rRNA U516 pseudouridylate synthase RsuA-like enzyme